MSIRQRAIGKILEWTGQPAMGAAIEDRHAHLRRKMGIDDSHPLTIIKQYGEYRTGSNALRALILENFDNALVLMHLLGDKHREPADFAAMARVVSRSDADDCRVVLKATWERPGGTTRQENYQQLAFVRAFAQPVASSIRDGELRIVLSVRHPVTWVEAVMRFWEWPPESTRDPWLDSEGISFAKVLCRRFNERYQSWFKMALEYGNRVRIVPIEAMEADWRSVVGELSASFPLHLRKARPVHSAKTVQPSLWDNCPPCYLKGSHRKRISARPRTSKELEAVIIDNIDWKLMARFGYHREPSVPAHPLIADDCERATSRYV